MLCVKGDTEMSLIEYRTRRLQRQFPPVGYQFPLIDGYTLTYHAAIRMLARQIEFDWVRDALASPSRPGNNGTRRHMGDYAICVVNPEQKIIVTVGYGRHNMPDDAPPPPCRCHCPASLHDHNGTGRCRCGCPEYRPGTRNELHHQARS
jgi:hypothetical protein